MDGFSQIEIHRCAKILGLWLAWKEWQKVQTLSSSIQMFSIVSLQQQLYKFTLWESIRKFITASSKLCKRSLISIEDLNILHTWMQSHLFSTLILYIFELFDQFMGVYLKIKYLNRYLIRHVLYFLLQWIQFTR